MYVFRNLSFDLPAIRRLSQPMLRLLAIPLNQIRSWSKNKCPNPPGEAAESNTGSVGTSILMAATWKQHDLKRNKPTNEKVSNIDIVVSVSVSVLPIRCCWQSLPTSFICGQRTGTSGGNSGLMLLPKTDDLDQWRWRPWPIQVKHLRGGWSRLRRPPCAGTRLLRWFDFHWFTIAAAACICKSRTKLQVHVPSGDNTSIMSLSVDHSERIKSWNRAYSNQMNLRQMRITMTRERYLRLLSPSIASSGRRPPLEVAGKLCGSCDHVVPVTQKNMCDQTVTKTRMVLPVTQKNREIFSTNRSTTQADNKCICGSPNRSSKFRPILLAVTRINEQKKKKRLHDGGREDSVCSSLSSQAKIVSITVRQ